MGFAKKKKKILKPSQQNKISLTFPLLSYIYIPTSKKKQRKKQRILHSQSPIPSQFEKKKKRIFENNILRKRRWFLLSKYKKKKKKISPTTLSLLNTYLNARPNYELPIIACPSSSIPPPLSSPIFELPSLSHFYCVIIALTHRSRA